VSSELPTGATRAEDGVIVLEGAYTRVELDTRRGGVIRSLAFRSHDWQPCLGTVAQGTFSAIDVAVDFYTGGTVVDLPGIGRRFTDLEPCAPQVSVGGGTVRATFDVGNVVDGRSFSRASVEVPERGEEVVLSAELAPARPRGSVRAGHLTLLPGAFEGPLWVETALGGAVERFVLDRDIEHGAPVSVLVSSTTSLGGGYGMVRIGSATRSLTVRWDPGTCAAVPMLHHRRVGDQCLARLMFSLAETDDTYRDEGTLLPLRLSISAD
jgi:hypothetical protein